MWALVESNSISKIYARPTALELNGIRHPANIFNLWTEAELKAIGIYEITVDNTNLKDKEYYQNTDITYTYNSSPDTVTGAYGTATAKSLNDTTSTDPSTGNQSTVYGLKTLHKNRVNSEANALLSTYDWYTLRATDGGTAVPSSVSTYRTAVRTKANQMTTAIDNAADVDALAALYVYNSDDPPTRPLGEFPDEPS